VIPFQKGKILSAADNERFFIKDGKRFHCYIDPRNGFPAGQGEAATLLLPEHPTLNLPVSVLLVVPPAEALQLVQSIPGAECLIVDQAQKVWVSPGWSHLAVEKFEAQDPSAGKQGQKKVRP
jgi:thiamine biosynthesis lipoprotein